MYLRQKAVKFYHYYDYYFFYIGFSSLRDVTQLLIPLNIELICTHRWTADDRRRNEKSEAKGVLRPG